MYKILGSLDFLFDVIIPSIYERLKKIRIFSIFISGESTANVEAYTTVLDILFSYISLGITLSINSK